jgi:hypothetical protein
MYSIKNIEETSCKMENQFEEIFKLISNIENLRSLSMTSDDFIELKNYLTEYRDYQRSYEKTYLDLKDVSNQIKALISQRFPNEAKRFEREEGVSILNADYDSSLKFYQELYDKAPSEYGKKLWLMTIEELKTKKRIVDDVKTRLTPEMQEKINAQKKMYENSSVTYRLANNIAKSMRKVYLEMYKANEKKETNPCRDFTL